MIDLSKFERIDLDAVLLVGAGAVDKSWEPVLTAVQSCKSSVRCKDSANVYFSDLVHRLRYWHAMANNPRIQAGYREGYAQQFENALKERDTLVSAISDNLRHWSGNHLRPAGNRIREHLHANFDSFSVISANWDLSAGYFCAGDREDNCRAVSYIHGTFDTDLYLPGEIASEPFRSAYNRSEMITTAIGAAQTLRDATVLLVYGLSVSPMDAELGFILSSAAAQRTTRFEKVIVINPEPDAPMASLRVHLEHDHILSVHPDQFPCGLL